MNPPRKQATLSVKNGQRTIKGQEGWALVGILIIGILSVIVITIGPTLYPEQFWGAMKMICFSGGFFTIAGLMELLSPEPEDDHV